MGTVQDYRERREKRLAERGIYPESVRRLIEYEVRKAKRLDERGIRMDDDAEEKTNNNNNGGGESTGGSGNTRLPFGLCMRYGIEIGKGWTPRDAWDALAGKGITPKDAYGKLKEGADPGVPDSPEPPKEPVKKLRMKTYGGEADYEHLRGAKISWASRGSEPWRLYGDRVEGSFEGSGWREPPTRMSEEFMTKMDMLRWLKGKGVEEFEDPETGEVLNPVEMDLPVPVMERGKTGYSAVSIGLRDGMYTVIATDYDGKKKKLYDFTSLAEAKGKLQAYGVKDEDIKLSPALKKREADRLAWLSSDKKLYFEEEGKRFGDVSLEDSGWGKRRWMVEGEAEDGKKFDKYFSTKAEAMKYLKDQGVESVRMGKEKENPMEYDVPEAKYTIADVPYQELFLEADRWGDVYLYGRDLDGELKQVGSKMYDETVGAFKDRVATKFGLSTDDFTMSDETKKKLAAIEDEEREKERRRKEFEAKAIDIPGEGKYMDVFLEKEGDGRYRIKGYDRDGDKRDISYWDGDMYDMAKSAERWGLDMNSIIKDDDVRSDYDKFMEKRREFESKAVEIAGEKYSDIEVTFDGRRWRMHGYTERGRMESFANESSYEELNNTLKQYGHSVDEFPMDESAKKKMEHIDKVKKALDSGEYFKFGPKKDEAYRDIEVKRDGDSYTVYGTDVEGDRLILDDSLSWDEAVTKLGDSDVSKYKMIGKDGQEMAKPTWGMHKVMLMKKPEGGYLVFADSKRYGDHAVMFESPKEEEAREWIRNHNVPDDGIKTRGMNPNDDAPRTHTAKSLSGFDAHRAEKAEEYPMLRDMDESTKVEVAQMLTDMFNDGAYRMNRQPTNFSKIVLGEFKNLLQTGTSGGSTFKDGRRTTGVETFGHDYDIAPKDAEKYGFWGAEDDLEALKDSTASGYGPVSFKFKKDTVGDRTTYTLGDTLDARFRISKDRPLAGYAGPKPTIEGISALSDDQEDLRAILKDYRRYKKGEMSFADFRRYLSRRCQDGYVECQFHGPLTIADVESITFPKRTMEKIFSKMDNDTRKKVLKKLRDSGTIIRYSENDELKNAWDYLDETYKER